MTIPHPSIVYGVQFVVPGKPEGQRRHRSRIVHSGFSTFARQYDPKESVDRKATIQHYAREAMVRASPMTGPVSAEVTAYFACQRSKWRKRDPVPEGWHASKPDSDNVLKSLFDACNGVVYLDDSQVVDVHFRKRRAKQGEPDRLVVRFTEATESDHE
jgi:Holliday junction resolvase RusA-like endonuclease